MSGAVEQVQAALDEGQKVLVFAHHLAVLDEIEQQLGSQYNAIRIDGSTSMDARKEAVDRFQQDPKVQLAILSIIAAGTGITLTAAQCGIFAELSWNPGHLIQAEDRAHRVGQKGTVLIRYLLAPGTCDDIMWSILAKKLKVVGPALDGAHLSRGLEMSKALINKYLSGQF